MSRSNPPAARPSTVATSGAAHALDTLRVHFTKTMRGGKVQEHELRAFMQASVIVSRDPVSAAIFGAWILRETGRAYSAQIDAALSGKKQGV